MKKYESFGEFLHEKRVSMGKSYRDMAADLDITAPYISDIEKERRNAPSMDVLGKITEYLGLSKEEEAIMFDLAGKSKDEIAPDIPGYIKDNESVVVALRTARDLGATDKDWEEFVKELKEKRG